MSIADLDIEAAAIASSISSRDALEELAVRLTPEHFYATNFVPVWGAILELHRAGKRVDIVAIHARLGAKAEALGGIPMLRDVARAPHDSAAAGEYAQAIIDRWKIRRLTFVCEQIIETANKDVADAQAFIDNAEAAILVSTSEDAKDDSIPTLGQAIVSRVVEINTIEGQPLDGIRTGLVDVDDLLGPMLPGQLVLLGAHSGIGKTSLAMQIASNAAARGAGVMVVSQEMTRAQLADRSLASAAGLDTRSIARGLERWQLTRIQEVADDIDGRPSPYNRIWIDDRSAVRPDQLRQRARRVARAAGRIGLSLDMMVIDYVQLMDGTPDDPKRRHQSYEREVAWISKQLLKIGREFGCVVFALAQLNEDARTESRYPRGEDLSQCKALRHDADKVILLHNASALARRTQEQESIQPTEGDLPPEIVQVIVDKNRGGREGMRSVLFLPSRSSFVDMTREDLRMYLEERRREKEMRTSKRRPAA